MSTNRIAVVLKGYPRLSETFIAQELLALERRGLPLEIWSLRRPTDRARHPMHMQIRAEAAYLPEYLHEAPLRVLRGLGAALRRRRLPALLAVFARDFRRDPTVSRMRRLGQALVLARELPADVAHIHVHFLHTPASVARYAALLTGRRWSFSAHAKDIWTTPDWELTEKLRDAAWGVTCTRDGLARLEALAPGQTLLAYHGLDLTRFPNPPPTREPRDGTDPARPFRLLCVGRLVAKKGHDDLIDALASLPPNLHWELDLIGGGELRAALEARVGASGFAQRIRFRGALAQPAVVEAMRAADLFVLPTKPAPGGDRDGLPNVLMEAATQALPILATAFAGTPEFIADGVHGVLVPPGAPAPLAAALTRLAGDPALRHRLGAAARVRLVHDFSEEAAIALIAGRLRASAGLTRDSAAHEPELSACAS
ncbi:colanic acid biosynthesis glycosyltransferase WcaL [Methylobacterium sp. P1-11]|uniref:glycosyltransferase family 4 protein n=1 Tax=Methylobacterium sp. P1-11 TaxID=2024616 RepID=UPI0011EEAAB9|nr:glycosyltransferase family 4 protein [Methylobacterium sp. P1-11]KAA0125674.1 colanic acid biosynthesis glycosyltransferase WcaL [Methylobacterium sp. P1-11]